MSASSAANGSSISSTRGSIASARAIATRCFIPPDSVCGYASANAARPTLSSAARERSAASRRDSRLAARSANATFSRTVVHGASWSNSWNTTIRSAPGPRTGSPASVIAPSTGATKPAIALSNVDLPQPDGPSSTKRSAP
ncbi:conserved hypothetical protein [Burkholderia pseudomallei 1710b]|uniref:Uncharacterized protein n=1 Tax=Burkholderia pseudomallei (strain 1710b) TaxID=320372 RepID=Q3JSM3_BURP1|nr:conserved hypothetical protein [Burkholderia pseudomallei 1710b]